MAKIPSDIRSIARPHASTAIKVLAGIMNQTEAPHAARVTAAQALLDRGFGKPTQTIDAEDGMIKALAGIKVTFGS